MWRYRSLLPVDGQRVIDLGTGFTPLLRAENLGRELGLRNLYLKNDSVNPTYSFKDRVVSVAVSKAIEFGFDTVACASTGNLANSVAAHAARAGLKCYVFIPAGLEVGKVLGTLIYQPNLVTVRGNYDEVNRLASEVADRYGWAFVNINLRAFYSEGSKTLAYETAEQLGWKIPDQVVSPIAGGSVLTKINKGFRELLKLGLVEGKEPRVYGAQATGCAPVARAFKAGAEVVSPVKPATIAKSLAIGSPADGEYALRTVRRTGGYIDDVSDDQIVDGMRLLARTEGVFTETAGGVTVAVLRKLAEQGRLDVEGVTVAYITGNGLKTVEAIDGCLAGAPGAIEPRFEEFEKTLRQKEGA
jgi:threonine synthase